MKSKSAKNVKEDENIDLEGNGDGYSGTFRWKQSKKLHSIPAPELVPKPEKGWMSYFLSRFQRESTSTALIQLVQSDLSIIDCLSSPVSVANLLMSTIFSDKTTIGSLKSLTIVCIGCAEKAEGRMLRETNVWDEIYYVLESYATDINIWIVGPEMASTETNIESNHLPRFHRNIFRGTSLEFFQQNPQLLRDPSTVVVGLNTGFGNFENPMPRRYELLKSWMPDLIFLTGTKLPVFFTCTNDYADVNGEVGLMYHIFGSRFIKLPQRNPFSYASTLVSDSKSNSDIESNYSCGNSFYYGVQGFDKDRRRIMSVKWNLNKENNEKSLLEILSILVKNQSEPIRLSTVPIDWKSTHEKSEINRQTCQESSYVPTSNDVISPPADAIVNRTDPIDIQEKISNSSNTASLDSNENSDKSDIADISTRSDTSGTSNNEVVASNGSIDSSSHLSLNDVSLEDDSKLITNTCQRVLDDKLIVEIQFRSDINVSMTNLDVLIGDDGKTLVLKSVDGSIDFNMTCARQVSRSSMRAKYSAKKKLLTISADVC